MTDHVDLDDLKDRVYFESATYDPRFVWRKIYPVKDVESDLLRANPGLTKKQITELGKIGITYSPVTDARWTDGFDRFMIVDCAHRDVDREGDVCGHCGKDFTPVKAPAKKTAARRRRK